MILASLVAATLLFECQVAPWRLDVRSAMQDSADVIVEGEVVGVQLVDLSEYGPRYQTAYDVTLRVERSWRQPLDSVVVVRVENIECDPNPEFLRRYIVGLKSKPYGWWAFSSLDPAYTDLSKAEVQAFTNSLGTPMAPSSPRPDWPRRSVLLVMAVAFAAGVGAVGARRLIRGQK